MVPAFDAAVNELFFEKYPAAVLEHQIQVRPFNAPQRHMRDLNPEGIRIVNLSENQIYRSYLTILFFN